MAKLFCAVPTSVIKDLNSTNGSFIGGEKITETVLKPGQILRLGQVELRIDDGTPVSAPPASSGSSPNSASAPAHPQRLHRPQARKKDGTMVIPRGVSLSDLEQGAARPTGFSTNTAFSKKKSKVNLCIIIGGIVIALVIVVLILVLITRSRLGRNKFKPEVGI